jgi:HlyD family secretion protein
LKKRLILIPFLALLVGVGGLVYFGQRRERSSESCYSGIIEATQANLSFQVNGRVNRVLVDEGQAIEKDQPLAELDRAEFEARRNQAEAGLERAFKGVKQLEAVLELYCNTLPAEVEKAEASVNALKSKVKELETGFRAQEVEEARLALDAARVAMEEAKRDKMRFDRLYKQKTVSENEKDAVDLRYETALKEYGRAREAYDLRKEGFRIEAIEEARAKLAEGQAVLKQAKANLKRIDVTEREVEAAKAEVKLARAALELAEIQLSYTRLRAPFRGVLTSRNVEPGEVVSPGREVLSLSDLSTVDLKIFVDETEIGKVKPGQTVRVTTDTFPEKVYAGHVAFISPEGEFTPKMIQTHKERVKLVYLVKVTIPNPDLELKSGMPADAWFQ